MLTYLNIGLVVSFIDVVMKNLKNHNLLKDLCSTCERWYYWIFAFVVMVIMILIDVVTWPITVLHYITAIKNKE